MALNCVGPFTFGFFKAFYLVLLSVSIIRYLA